ncbi:MAG TPA: CHAP domain-containing protein [Candidatus Saccharibacteria bacterium]|nr:CHAP domain-containing protein [Candidatus Saccharibacteria bacterium]HMT55967.1 CHAP domain-containing protein [Candidatus Saccharibacteria bacterium]
MNRKVKRSLFRSKRRLVRYGLLITNLLLVGTIAGFIVSTRNSRPTTDAPVLNLTQEKEVIDPLDAISGADIAVNVAQLVRLDQTTAVINSADSVKSQLDIIPNDTQVVAKPQIVDTALKSKKDIVTYKVVEGDTVTSIAQKFGVSADSIKWSNAIRSDKVQVDTELFIPPVNGLVHKVEASDTADTLATKYRADKDRIVAFNDAEIGGLKEGERIVIPDGQQAPEPVFARVVSYGSSAVYGYNGYDYGWCTWYVANRRIEQGRALPTNLGNAGPWAYNAVRLGLPTGKSPAVGAAAVTDRSNPGHVALVEEVLEDGSVWISEMNSRGQVSKNDGSPAGGWGRVDWKLIPADRANTFTYIY